METGKYIQIAALLGGLAVLIGAFGAHGLGPVLESTGRAETFETAVKYHFYHALAMLFTAVLAQQFPNRSLGRVVWLFLAGILVFSGSLYVLSITGITWLGAITPFGGMAFVLGWVFLFWSFRPSIK